MLRAEFARVSSSPRRPIDHFFIIVGTADDRPVDPTPKFLARFAGHTPPLTPASDAAESSAGFGHKVKGGRGVLFGAGHVRHTDRDTVEVIGFHGDGRLGAAKHTYRLKRRDGKWTVIDTKLLTVS